MCRLDAVFCELHAVLKAQTCPVGAISLCLLWQGLQLPGANAIKRFLLEAAVLIVEKLPLKKLAWYNEGCIMLRK